MAELVDACAILISEVQILLKRGEVVLLSGTFQSTDMSLTLLCCCYQCGGSSHPSPRNRPQLREGFRCSAPRRLKGSYKGLSRPGRARVTGNGGRAPWRMVGTSQREARWRSSNPRTLKRSPTTHHSRPNAQKVSCKNVVSERHRERGASERTNCYPRGTSCTTTGTGISDSY